MSAVSTIHFGGLAKWLKWMYMKMIWRLNFFTHMGPGKLSAGHLFLINALYLCQKFYALSLLQQQLLGKYIRSQTLTLNKLWKHIKTNKMWPWIYKAVAHIWSFLSLGKNGLFFFSKFLSTYKELLSVKLKLEITLALSLPKGPFFLNFSCYF